MITDDIYYSMIDTKSYQDFTRCPWYMKLVKSNELTKDTEGKNAKSKIKFILKELMKVMGSYQYGLYG